MSPSDETWVPFVNPAPVCETEKDVTVIVPWQGQELKILKTLELEVPVGTQSATDGDPATIEITRLVIDFKVVKTLGREATVTVFDPPVGLQVAYTSTDVQNADGSQENLVLCYWAERQWQPFTQAAHGFLLTGDDNGGFGSVWIREWDDRPIAWGRHLPTIIM